MSAGQYELFATVVGGVCLVAWIVLLGHLGSLVRNGAPLKERIQAVGFALLSMVALLMVLAANPLGAYAGEGIVVGVCLAVMGGLAYVIAWRMPN